MPAYSLGAFNFFEANVDGQPGAPPGLPAEEIEAMPAPPGIDGVAIRNNGRKGVPFQYRTCAYTTATVAAGSSLYQLYTLARGQVPQNLVWEGIDYDTASIRFSVLDVGQFQLKRVSGLIVDGSVIGNAMLVYATWVLLPVDM